MPIATHDTSLASTEYYSHRQCRPPAQQRGFPAQSHRTKDDDTIAALVDAFETYGLTLGSTTQRTPTDHLGRFRKAELTAALTNFDQSLRDKVIAVLQKVGGIAPAD
jgi:hypothetical protein